MKRFSLIASILSVFISTVALADADPTKKNMFDSVGLSGSNTSISVGAGIVAGGALAGGTALKLSGQSETKGFSFPSAFEVSILRESAADTQGNLVATPTTSYCTAWYNTTCYTTKWNYSYSYAPLSNNYMQYTASEVFFFPIAEGFSASAKIGLGYGQLNAGVAGYQSGFGIAYGAGLNADLLTMKSGVLTAFLSADMITNFNVGTTALIGMGYSF